MENIPLIQRNQELEILIEQLKKEYTVLKENFEQISSICSNNICGICFDSEVESFNECGHAYCNGCITKLKTCKTCQSQIRNIKKIFYN
jgi:hypothetical protein